MAQDAVAIVGSETLAGRELREVLRERKVPWALRLIGAEPDTARLSEEDGEAVVIQPFEAEALREARVVFLAGSRASSRQALEFFKRHPGPEVVDLTYAAEEEPAARLRAPLLEASPPEVPPGTIHVVAHPAAVAAALLLARLDAWRRIVRSVLHIFEPASERGQRGVEELEKQTVSLLSLRELPRRVYGTQVGFALLARYGSEAPESLESVELRIERHLATLLAGNIPLPSLRLVQAPVFHGYTLSAWVELEQRAEADEVARILSSELVDVRHGDLEPPTNVGVAGQSGIAVGAIAPDRNHPRACWLWAAADNLRLLAENAVSVAAARLAAAGGR
ncbi:MAG: Asd/ArgC dimerization domain-containing protein [Bryobacterales bacterium]|nr:Asd/ArgC dimerization domain-containing protein [Bryobacteraceae bacterium]MDW8356154.1 Asd/ArgC dimerization domain-containing protein [Bryobacterales bacterium]